MKSKQAKLWDISACAALAGLAAFIFISSSFRHPEFGTVDFIEYWSAFQLATNQSDPYSYDAMLHTQQILNPSLEAPTMMWNPPYILTLLYPIMLSSFSASAQIFCVINLFSIGALALVISQMLRAQPGQRGRILMLGIAFPASLTCLQLGQLGILLGLLLLVGIVLHQRNQRFLAGCVFALCTIKPHLFLLVLALLFANDLLLRRFEMFFGGLVTISLLSLLTEAIFPGIFASWIYALQHPENHHGYNVLSWRTATVVGLFRVMYWKLTDLPMPLTPIWLIPLLNLTVWFGLMAKLGPQRLVRDYMPEILLFSSLFSPYGWNFDQTFLLYPWAWAYLRLGERIHNREPLKILIFLASISVTYLLIRGLGLVSECFVLLTVPVLFAVLVTRGIKKESVRNNEHSPLGS